MTFVRSFVILFLAEIPAKVVNGLEHREARRGMATPAPGSRRLHREEAYQRLPRGLNLGY